MFRKITFILALLLSTFAFAQGRQRSVGSGMNDAALMPMPVAGTTVSGTVTAVHGNLIELAGGAVTVDASSAKITDDSGNAGTIASVTVGTSIFAVLSSDVTTNTPLPASMIAVRRTAQVELSGPVSAVDTAANTLTLLGRTIRVDGNTSFGGRAYRLSDIVAGDFVSVSANASGGSLLAVSVLVMRMTAQPPVVIHGTVKSIGTDSWVITDKAAKDWTVVINAQTKIIGDPKVGDAVEILANLDNAHQYVAVSIMKSPIVLPLVSFSGEVKAISPASWTIHDARANKDVTIAIDSKTIITGNPQVNDGVTVMATVDEAGNYTAVTIIKLGIVPPLTMTINGVVKNITVLPPPPCAAPPYPCPIADWTIGPSVGMGPITMGPDILVRVTTETKIGGDPKVGDHVEAKVQMSSGGPFVALSITKR